MEGISWSWQSIDGALVKAPLVLEAVGRNPTDRGGKGNQTAFIDGRAVESRYQSSLPVPIGMM